jgi:hypothetical protein
MARQFNYSFPNYGHYEGGAWPAIERRSITTLTRDDFQRDFVTARTPVIITGFNATSSVDPFLQWGLHELKEQCENWPFNLRNHYYHGIKILKREKWLWAVIGRMFNSRVAATHGPSTTIDHVMRSMMHQWTVGSFIRALNDTTQDFEKMLHANPDYYSHIVDFLHPPTMHTIDIRHSDCPSFYKAADNFLQQHKLMHHQWVKHLFVASKGSQAYPLHQHGTQNENMIMVLEGSKRVVIAPPSSARYLYESPELAVNEGGDRVFFANLFTPDFDTQPHVQYARAMEGVVGKHELLYIPANTVHAVRNLENILAVAWHMDHGEHCNGEDCNGKNPKELLLSYPADCSYIEERSDFSVNADCSPASPR